MNYLTPQEQLAVQMLAEDKNRHAICEAIELPIHHYSVFMGKIRRKTGILNVRMGRYAREYLANVEIARRNKPTPDQMNLLAQVAIGNQHVYDANTVVSALRAAGIFSNHPVEQKSQSRMYLVHREKAPNEKSLTAAHKRILHLYALGKDLVQIAYELGWKHAASVERCLREAIDSLGVTARGRGVQRKLVGIALERIKETPHFGAPHFGNIPNLDEY